MIPKSWRNHAIPRSLRRRVDNSAISLTIWMGTCIHPMVRLDRCTHSSHTATTPKCSSRHFVHRGAIGAPQLKVVELDRLSVVLQCTAAKTGSLILIAAMQHMQEEKNNNVDERNNVYKNHGVSNHAFFIPQSIPDRRIILAIISCKNNNVDEKNNNNISTQYVDEVCSK